MPRTTTDLANELLEKRAFALVIGFDNDTKFVWRGQESAPKEPSAIKEEINTQVAAGGEPIALLFEEAGKMTLTPLEEYANEIWVGRYLTALSGHIELQLIGKGGKPSFSLPPAFAAREGAAVFPPLTDNAGGNHTL